MTVRSQHAGSGSHWLRTRPALLLLMAALGSAAGCASGGAAVAEDDEASTTEPGPEARADPTRAALQSGAYATPQAIGGFCVQGVGVYLSAVQDTAELTLYVVAPAQSATFARPALYLTTQEGESSKTEVAEFEDVTLQAGESFVLRKETEDRLLEVFADFEPGEG
ncbi:MAG TPA: hypothetical protein VJR89_17260 [Polyangiales bacterium]|nr:hypothetical protein [Polyangiales bacterium]